VRVHPEDGAWCEGADRTGDRVCGRVLGMGMMGLGGLISIIGGVIFLVVALKSIFGEPEKTETAA